MTALLCANAAHLGLTLLGSALLVVLLHLQERATGRFVAHRLGWRAVLITGWLGVPLHELSHLISARLFGHRIIAWKLLDPDPVSGTLGYVRHAYARRSPWQLLGNLFIGLSPLVAGSLALGALLTWMVTPAALVDLWAVARATGEDLSGPLAVASGTRALLEALSAAIWRNRGPLLPLQLYLGICVASHMAPSRADLAGALSGGAVLTLILAGVTAVAAYRGLSLAGTEVVLVALLLLLLAVGIFQACYASVVMLVDRLTNRMRFRDTV